MENVNPERDEGEEAPVILDISSSTVTGLSRNMDNLYFESNEDDQKLVSQFLDGEINFNDYIDNIKGPEAESENVDERKFSLGEVETVGSAEFANDAPKPSTSRSYKKSIRKLPPALKGLMGQANVLCAKGDKETAVRICLEIIRQVPKAPEPFLTLVNIYEEMGDEENSLKMALVAAHLTGTDIDQWINLAETSERLGQIKQAITCYNKAINLDLQNLDIHRKRAVLLEATGDKKTAIKGYIRLLSSLKPDQGNYIIYLAKYVAEMCHKENDISKASEALDVAIQKCPDLVNLEFVNLQLELCLQLKNFRKAMKLMERFCDLQVETTNDGDQLKIINAAIPEATEIDIIAKLIVVLIHLDAKEFVPELVQPILNLGPSETGDLFLDIVDAYTEKGCHEEAEPLLQRMVGCEEYDLPGVWLSYAENQKVLGHKEEACRAFYKVLEQKPQHSEARLTLASLLVELGRADEAIGVLTQTEHDYVDVNLLYKRCLLLREDPARAQELIMVAQVLFSRHSTQIRNKDELSSISIIQRYDRKRQVIKNVRKSRQEPELDDDTPAFVSDGPSVLEEWDLFKYVCQLCIERKMYMIFQRLTFTAQLSTVFHIFKFEIDVLSALSAYYNKDCYNGYNIIRTLVAKHTSNVNLWHLFNMIITKSDDARHNRFIMRQLARNSDHPALGILHGNNCLVSGTYKYAMHEYSTIYRRDKQPLTALLLGLTYLQMAAQKFTSKKHQLVVQSVALLAQYKDLRGPEGIQEVHYNLGRSFHHLGLYTPAIFHYKKVLEIRDLPIIKSRPDIFDLTKEAAFNLHLIYVQSENYDLARMYLDKYVVV
uniref:General transcription factor 3C polypeptide 3 n=1 Tax=Lygus hesperus TaxID=30085 RepID=A0A146LCN4_LYGHE